MTKRRHVIENDALNPLCIIGTRKPLRIRGESYAVKWTSSVVRLRPGMNESLLSRESVRFKAYPAAYLRSVDPSLDAGRLYAAPNAFGDWTMSVGNVARAIHAATEAVTHACDMGNKDLATLGFYVDMLAASMLIAEESSDPVHCGRGGHVEAMLSETRPLIEWYERTLAAMTVTSRGLSSRAIESAARPAAPSPPHQLLTRHVYESCSAVQAPEMRYAFHFLTGGWPIELWSEVTPPWNDRQRLDMVLVRGGRRMIVEADSVAYHGGASQLDKDRKRDRAGLDRNTPTRRFMASEINRDPRGCSAEIIGAMVPKNERIARRDPASVMWRQCRSFVDKVAA